MSEPITTGIRRLLEREFTIAELVERCDAIDAVYSGLEDLIANSVEESDDAERKLSECQEELAAFKAKYERLFDAFALYKATVSYEDLLRDNAYGDMSDLRADAHAIMSRVRQFASDPWLS